MKNARILTLSFLLLGLPLCMSAQSEREEPETEMHSVTLAVDGTKVHVSGAEGAVLEVYGLTGTRVASYRIDSNDKSIQLNGLARGYYILKVGKVVRKVSIR